MHDLPLRSLDDLQWHDLASLSDLLVAAFAESDTVARRLFGSHFSDRLRTRFAFDECMRLPMNSIKGVGGNPRLMERLHKKKLKTARDFLGWRPHGKGQEALLAEVLPAARFLSSRLLERLYLPEGRLIASAFGWREPLIVQPYELEREAVMRQAALDALWELPSLYGVVVALYFGLDRGSCRMPGEVSVLCGLETPEAAADRVEEGVRLLHRPIPKAILQKFIDERW